MTVAVRCELRHPPVPFVNSVARTLCWKKSRFTKHLTSILRPENLICVEQPFILKLFSDIWKRKKNSYNIYRISYEGSVSRKNGQPNLRLSPTLVLNRLFLRLSHWAYCQCPGAKVTNGSPGLMVMGDDSCSRGCGFESRHHILDGYFSHWFVGKIVLFVWKDRK